MCFSATASFLVSGALCYIGSLALKKIRKPQQKYIAYIPFLFAIQQAAEGVIWLSGTAGSTLARMASYLFLVIAFTIWPTWMPFSIMKLERNSDHRRILFWLTIFGLFLSLYFLILLIKTGAVAKIIGCHIYYHFYYDNPYFFDMGYLYVIPTILPFFFSTVPRVKTIGLILIASLIISYSVWHFFFTSIWCFFAALISLLILTIL